MKRTRIEKIPFCDIPEELERLCRGADIYDSSCSEAARVYYLDTGCGYFAKRSPRASLKTEATMTEYFSKLGLGAEVICYESDEVDWLVTTRVAGEDLTDERFLREPKRLADFLGEELRKLHSINPVGCPIANRIEGYLSLAEKNYREGSYDKSSFPDSFGYRSAEEAWSALEAGKDKLRSEVLIHGDYCLPNIMANDNGLTGFIDLGGAGIGDRHIDLFWGGFTLGYNLGTDAYRDRFFDAYGRDAIDEERLLTVAAAEVFG